MMKHFKNLGPWIVLTGLVALFPLYAWSQEVVQEVSNSDFLFFLLKSLGGLSGASGLVASAVLVQLAMKGLQLPYFDKYFGTDGEKNHYKIPILYALNFVGAVLTLKGQGLDLPTILLHSQTSASFQLAFHQTVKQFVPPKN